VQIQMVGSEALLVEVDDHATALSLATWARSAAVESVEIVPAARTVLFDGVADPQALRDLLASWSPSRVHVDGPLVEIPTSYDGEDLAFVGEAWGTDRDGVVARHRSIEFVSSFCGFAPGFAYLAGLPDELAVPRLDSPRSRLAAGSVALGGPWCGIYPTSSPGGWRVIGHTDLVLWDATSARPALLAPGTRVRFVPR